MVKLGKRGKGDSAGVQDLPLRSGEQLAVIAVAELLAAPDGMPDARPEELRAPKPMLGVCATEQGGDLAVAHAELPGIKCQQRVA